MNIINKINKIFSELFFGYRLVNQDGESSLKIKKEFGRITAQAELSSLIFLRTQFNALIKKAEKIKNEASKNPSLEEELTKKGINVSELLDILQKSVEKMDRAGELYDEAFRTTEAYNEFKKVWSELSDLLNYFVDYEEELNSLDRFLPSELKEPRFERSIEVIRELFKKGRTLIRLEDALMRLLWDEETIKGLRDFIIKLDKEKIDELREGKLVPEFAEKLATFLYEELGADREDVKRILERKLHGKKLKDFIEKIERGIGRKYWVPEMEEEEEEEESTKPSIEGFFYYFDKNKILTKLVPELEKRKIKEFTKDVLIQFVPFMAKFFPWREDVLMDFIKKNIDKIFSEIIRRTTPK